MLPRQPTLAPEPPRRATIDDRHRDGSVEAWRGFSSFRPADLQDDVDDRPSVYSRQPTPTPSHPPQTGTRTYRRKQFEKAACMTPDPGGDTQQSPEQADDGGDQALDLDPSDVTIDGDPPECGVPKKTSDGRCSHPVPNGACPVHGDEDDRLEAVQDGDVPVRDGVGSGTTDHPFGDGAAPEGNKNAMTHGVHASRNDPWGTLDHLQDEEPMVYAQVVRWFWDESRTAAFPIYVGGRTPDLPDDPLADDGVPGVDVAQLTADAADLLLVCLDRGIIYRATMSQATDGLATSQKRKNSDGDYVDVIDEHPVNLPKNRMRREDRFQLKDLGQREYSPDSVAAQGQADLAEAAERVAKRKERDQDGHPDADVVEVEAGGQ